jgi:phosphoglycolate phosphatase
MTLPTPKAIIFDWDNTLVNTWPLIHCALNATFDDMGVAHWTLDEVMARVGKSLRDSFPALFGEDWQKAGDLYRKHYRARHLADLQPLPLAREVLEAVKARKIYTVVVSNKLGDSLRAEVEHMGGGGYFGAVVGSDDAPNDKPHADPVHMAFAQSGMTPGRDVWFIGDSEVDLECAKATGCVAVLYGESSRNHAEYTPTHYRGFAYDAHVYEHGQTLALLRAAES